MSARIAPDGIDLEHLEDLARHTGYRMVADRLRATLAQTLADLENSSSWEQVRFLQGQIKALRIALGMPDQLVKETRAKMKQSPKAAR